MLSGSGSKFNDADPQHPVSRNLQNIYADLNVPDAGRGVADPELGTPHVDDVALEVLLRGEGVAAGGTVEAEPGRGADVAPRLVHAHHRAALTTRQAAHTHIYKSRYNQCFGSGLDPDSIRSVDTDQGGQK